jgi:thiamine biosynthesis lipoprotein
MQEASRIARKLSALVDMGLERVDVSPVTTEAIRVDRKAYKVTSSTPAMGTLVSISALGPSKDEAEQAIGRAFEEMDRLIGIFSRFDASSAVSHLNDGGRLDSPPPEFSHVVSRSLDYHELSHGAFDITVAPVVDMFRERLDGAVPHEPTDVEIMEVLELVGSRNVTLSRRRISFAKSGMGITLDGIAKGYIVDAVAKALERHRIQNYLINAGGDLRAAGTKEKKQPWTVAVKDPSGKSCFPDTIHLTNAAVATSGSYEIYFDRDKLFHHLVDSQTGRSPNVNASVSVIAPSTMAADALATTVFVGHPGKVIAFIDSLPGCECLIIDNNGSQLKSGGWKSTAPTNGEETAP